jgi:hypothetical protein
MRILLLFFCIFCSTAVADDFLATMQIPGNECLGSVAFLRSGDIVAGGNDFTSGDALLIRMNSEGDVLRAQRIVGSSSDEIQGVLATSDGGAVVIGNTASFGAGNADAFILKIRSTGAVAWKRTFGTSGNEHFVEVVQTRDNGFIVLGDADHDPNLNDIVVAKFNSTGRFIWRKVFSAGDFDHASDLSLTSDGGVIVAIAAFFPDRVRSVITKISGSGSVQWSKMYGSSGDHIAVSVTESDDGGYYFTETFTPTGSQRSDNVLSKLDSSGNLVWSRIYRSPSPSPTFSVLKTGDGLLLTGHTGSGNSNNSLGVIISLDENGNIRWRKKVKLDSRPVFLGRPVVSAESILISGCAGNRTTNNMDSMVLKMQPNGQIQGGCSRLTNFPLSRANFNLTSSEIVLQEIPVPLLTSFPGFQITTFTAGESLVCSGE